MVYRSKTPEITNIIRYIGPALRQLNQLFTIGSALNEPICSRLFKYTQHTAFNIACTMILLRRDFNAYQSIPFLLFNLWSKIQLSYIRGTHWIFLSTYKNWSWPEVVICQWFSPPCTVFYKLWLFISFLLNFGVQVDL